MNNRGYTLLELLIIIAVMSTISLGVYESIVHFQSQSQVEAAAAEFTTTVKTAQAKSRDGQLPQGAVETDYTPDGLPIYGVTLTASDYTLHQYHTLNSTVSENIVLETHVFDSSITFSPGTYSVIFSRMTGLPDNPQSIQITRGGITTPRVLTITGDGLIAYDQ